MVANFSSSWRNLVSTRRHVARRLYIHDLCQQSTSDYNSHMHVNASSIRTAKSSIMSSSLVFHSVRRYVKEATNAAVDPKRKPKNLNSSHQPSTSSMLPPVPTVWMAYPPLKAPIGFLTLTMGAAGWTIGAGVSATCCQARKVENWRRAGVRSIRDIVRV